MTRERQKRYILRCMQIRSRLTDKAIAARLGLTIQQVRYRAGRK